MRTYLIDDDPISLFFTEQMLRLGGFQAPIFSFTSAEEALIYLLPRLATEPPQVIFLDLNMPVMNGWQFLDALKPHVFALQGHCRIYLLTSSLALADTALASEHALALGVIHKPLDEDEAKAILQDANPLRCKEIKAPIIEGQMVMPIAKVSGALSYKVQ